MDYLKRKSRFASIIFISLTLLCVFGVKAFTQVSSLNESFINIEGLKINKISTPHVTTHLISDFSQIKDIQKIQIGWYFKLKPEWHIYWRNPGDSGEPPKIEWKLPAELQGKIKISELYFPPPHRIEVPPLVNYGYEDEALLAVDVELPKNLTHLLSFDHTDKNTSQQLHLRASATWLVCKVECIPEEAELEIFVPLGNKNRVIENTPWQERFDQLLAQQPDNLPQIETPLNVSSDHFRIRLDLRELNVKNIQKAHFEFFPWKSGLIKNASTPELIEEDKNFYLTIPRDNSVSLDDNKLEGFFVVSFSEDQKKNEEKLNQQKKIYFLKASSFFHKNVNTIDLTTSSSFALWPLAFAFLGGILLNLMPCVFPVLSIKVLNFLQKSQHDKAHLKIHAWIYTLGVLLSFWVLVTVLLLLRQGGEQLGWGFHLQSPYFLVILVYLIFFFTLSLWGIFEIGSSWIGLGSSMSQGSGYMPSFWTGVFATIVATPCMAPMMGSAIGFALTRSVLEVFLIFTLIALGMALPYLLLCYFPQWRKLLPKPGSWMHLFQQGMGFLLAATVLWLLWVLSFMIAAEALLQVLGGILVLSALMWLFSRLNIIWQLKTALLLISVAVSLYIGFQAISNPLNQNTHLSQSNKKHSSWEEFSEEKLNQYLNQDRSVFINFTAAWCVSCQVNDRLVLRSEEVKKAFKDNQVVLLKADWTSKDENIAKILSDYGRQGVPLYVFYGQNKENKPIILPEILTKSVVLDLMSPALQNSN